MLRNVIALALPLALARVLFRAVCSCACSALCFGYVSELWLLLSLFRLRIVRLVLPFSENTHAQWTFPHDFGGTTRMHHISRAGTAFPYAFGGTTRMHHIGREKYCISLQLWWDHISRDKYCGLFGSESVVV